MTMSRNRYMLSALLLLAGCKSTEATRPTSITVAAAANLSDTFTQLGKEFTRKTGITVVFSFGSTAQLAQQIDEAAPFDVFAAADREHVDELVTKGKLAPSSRAIYARGRLALWAPTDAVKDLAGLSAPEIRFVAVAKPAAAPYGKAAVQTLHAAGLWAKVEPKVVYANNISMAKQLAASGNADAAFTAYSLVRKEKGTIILIAEALHEPIDQALAVVAASPHGEAAQRFTAFVLGPEGQALLKASGYLTP